MKVESNVMPAAQFEVLPYEGDEVEVLFYENIEASQGEDETVKYSYDYYRIIIKDRPNLSDIITTYYSEWLNFAKDEEVKNNTPKPTLEQRMTSTETKVVTIEEVIDVLVGGVI